MPLYDFRCRACGARFEANVPYGQSPPCPECGACEGERLVSPFAGPFTVGLRGAAARRSNALRHTREEQRRERREQRREREKE
jgi:putative FmdB family regulatory protein